MRMLLSLALDKRGQVIFHYDKITSAKEFANEPYGLIMGTLLGLISNYTEILYVSEKNLNKILILEPDYVQVTPDLKYVELKIISNQICTYDYNSDIITNSKLCTDSSQLKSTCHVTSQI
jgi:hypothetical protein